MEKLKIYGFILVLFFQTKIVSQNNIVETIGDIALYTSPLVVLGTAIVENDKQGLYMYAKGFLLNAAVTLALKEITNKERPNGNDLKSFPSGHTSATFQAAAYLQKRYGWSYGVPAYLVASYTGYSRVYAQKHFVEDVVAGAALGVLSSFIFTKKQKDSKSVFTFSKSKEGYYVSYYLKF